MIEEVACPSGPAGSSGAIRPPVKWHGGKGRLASRMIEHFPEGYEEMTYVEPYGGAASLLLRKNPSKVEVYNDLDRRIVNLFQVCREHPDELRRRLSLTPYAEAEFADADLDDVDDRIEQARRFYVQCRQSMGGRGTTFSASNRPRGGRAGDVNAWLSSIDENLPRVIERFRDVQIHCRPALDVIRKYDGPNTLYYLDPPYVPTTREANSRDVYGCEMSEADHAELLEALAAIRGRFILSGYPSDLYAEFAERCGWPSVQIDVPNNAASGSEKARRIEVLWFNWLPPDTSLPTSEAA